MSVIWSILIIVSIVFSIYNGSIIEMNNVILTTSFEALKTFGFIASNIILWSGVLEVCIESGTIKYMTFFVKPIVKRLFKTKNNETLDCISANIACNIFALGSASTPFAIKAMTNLQEENENKNKESKDMATLIIINVCGFTIIPTSLMSLRANYNSQLNAQVLCYILLFSFLTTVLMLILDRIFRR